MNSKAYRHPRQWQGHKTRKIPRTNGQSTPRRKVCLLSWYTSGLLVASHIPHRQNVPDANVGPRLRYIRLTKWAEMRQQTISIVNMKYINHNNVYGETGTRNPWPAVFWRNGVLRQIKQGFSSLFAKYLLPPAKNGNKWRKFLFDLP